MDSIEHRIKLRRRARALGISVPDLLSARREARSGLDPRSGQRARRAAVDEVVRARAQAKEDAAAAGRPTASPLDPFNTPPPVELLPAPGADERAVYGNVNTTRDYVDARYSFAALPYEGGNPEMDYRDADPLLSLPDFSDSDDDDVDAIGLGNRHDRRMARNRARFGSVIAARPRLFVSPGRVSGGLAGPLDWMQEMLGTAGNFWSEKYDQAMAELQAAVGSFLQNRKTLLDSSRVLGEVKKASAKRGGSPEAQALLSKLGGELVTANANQNEIEGRIKGIYAKVRGNDASAAAGLGIIPLVIGAGAAAVIVAVTGAAIMHTNATNELAREIDLVAKGTLTADQIARIKSSGSLLGSLTGGISIGVLVAGGVALWLFMRSRKA